MYIFYFNNHNPRKKELAHFAEYMGRINIDWGGAEEFLSGDSQSVPTFFADCLREIEKYRTKITKIAVT